MDVDLAEIERELSRIPEVTAVRLVTDQFDRPVEVHVLATPAKHPKQLVRDIQSVAKVSFDMELDHRVISVVQLDNGNLPEALQNGSGATATAIDDDRITVSTVSTARSGLRATAKVGLRRGDIEEIGEAEGTVASGTINVLVARATLDALSRHDPRAGRLDVEGAALQNLGTRSFATASIVLLNPPYEEVLLGSAPVRSAGPEDAIARAVLDATNRRLSFVV
ncbi:MAG TPA: hypothetical protein VM938_06785 [Acidimicrobiales bacterium]|nr:hypothetical protein [Acidimicrobiales bacterium]